MLVILKEKIKNLGNIEDIVNVKAGYGRNFLIPYNKAIYANKINIYKLQLEQQKQQKIEEEKIQAAKLIASILQNKTLIFAISVNKSNKIFGSFGKKEIISEINNKFSVVIDKKCLNIDDKNITKLGNYTLNIILHKKVQFDFQLKLISK